MRNFILVLLAVLVLGGGGYLIYTKMFKSSFVENSQVSNNQRNNLEITGTTVSIKNFTYTPKTLTIKAGDTVTWTNEDSMAHDAVADDGSWKTELMDQGQSQQIKFEKRGTYTYFCSIHPSMKGTIVVE